MPNENVYEIAGIDMRPFVEAWLEHLFHGGGEMHGLLQYAEEDKEPGDRYFYSSTFLMGNAAPAAAAPDATPSDLILYAALVLYQEPSREDRPWPGFEQYVRDAFTTLKTLGASGAATALLQRRVDESVRPPDPILEWLRGSRGPASKAAHERNIAEIHQRDIRAAQVLDPGVDFNEVLLGSLNADQPEGERGSRPD